MFFFNSTGVKNTSQMHHKPSPFHKQLRGSNEEGHHNKRGLRDLFSNATIRHSVMCETPSSNETMMVFANTPLKEYLPSCE